MELILDANILFSALIKNSITIELIRSEIQWRKLWLQPSVSQNFRRAQEHALGFSPAVLDI
ncbi:MAG: hypothetical protein V1859_05320 [archaeon]